MKVFLMHADRDFDFGKALPANAQTLMQDLELETPLRAMAAGDQALYEVAQRALLSGLTDPGEIMYRQQVLSDCIEHAAVARELYTLAGDALKAEKTVWGGLYREAPHSLLAMSVQKLELLVGFLKRLRVIVDGHAGQVRSEGLGRFIAMVAEELDEQYFDLLDSQLKDLKFGDGMLLSAGLAAGNKSEDYMLRRAPKQTWVNLVANALAQSVEHVHGFFVQLWMEAGFYVSCVNLSEALAAKGEPICLPLACTREEHRLAARSLYDVALTLKVEQRIVGNDVLADGKSLVMITGANQGGKSTLLRALGVAQLMMQAGMFVAAESFEASICEMVFTHFKREEDEGMESGKLDEELARMSEIADRITPGCVLLCNESFAATNEREGSEIARQVVRALLERGIKVLFVTHMFDLADGLHRSAAGVALFLRAERGPSGDRNYKLNEAAPLPTSYGEDAYERVFGAGLEPAGSRSATAGQQHNPA
jgi:MutS domain V